MKRATSRGIVQITMEGVEVVEAAPWIVNVEITTVETVVTDTAETVVTATAEMVVTASTTGAIAHALAATLPVTIIAEKETETEAVMETEVVMKWVGAWVRLLEGITRDRHLANKKIVTVM